MSAPDVTVILPVHEAGPSLAAGLERLGATDLVGCEIVLVDDGSQDGSGALLESFAEGRCDTVVIRLPRNGGVALARNLALRRAGGEYLWFVDWDDEWDPSIVRTMLRRARATQADLVVCRAVRDGVAAEPLDGLPQARVMSGSEAFDLVLRGRLRGYLWSKLVRREALGADPFPRQRSQSDFCGIVPVLASCAVVATEPAVLYRHLTRPGSITNTADPDLGNLYRCARTVRAVAAGLPRSTRREALLDFYDHRFLHLSVANTAMRLGSTPQFRAAGARRVARDLRWAGIAGAARIDPGIGLRCLLVKLTGSRYAAVYRTAVGMRTRLRRTARSPG